MKYIAVITIAILAGCAHITRGSRPLHEPHEPLYRTHLAAQKQTTPILVKFCERFGDPDGIEIGLSGTYYAWKNPRMILSIKGFSQVLYLRFSTAYDYLLGVDSGEYKINIVSPAEFIANPEDILAKARSAPAFMHIFVPAAQTYAQGGQKSLAAVPIAPSVRPSGQQQALYRVDDFHRIAESDFAYAFRLNLINPNVNLSTIRSIKDELRREVLDDYRATFPNARSSSLQVDFPQFDVSASEVCGRAEVMSFAIVSMNYNQESRRGIIRVRIGASSFEEARRWVRSNIETLSRDKNIALTTGEIPPAAQFILGAERVQEGGILEVEFETL